MATDCEHVWFVVAQMMDSQKIVCRCGRCQSPGEISQGVTVWGDEFSLVLNAPLPKQFCDYVEVIPPPTGFASWHEYFKTATPEEIQQPEKKDE